MKNALTTLRIQNFKSIKDVELKPRRVNLIIGEPNVGKSNILEAMSLLGGLAYEQTDRFMGSFIRYEEPRQLFYDNIVANEIRIQSSLADCRLGGLGNGTHLYYRVKKPLLQRAGGQNGFNETAASVEDSATQTIFSKGKMVYQGSQPAAPFPHQEVVSTAIDEASGFGVDGHGSTYEADPDFIKALPLRPYVFAKGHPIGQEFPYTYLNPPHGSNLINVIQAWPELRKEISKLFDRYDQKLLLRMDMRRLEIIKDMEGMIFSYPYSSVADTLQRIIFYLAAIASNDDAVILLEEPEAHSYPVYVAKLGRRMVESCNNQFFVATHSPYLITEVLEKMLTDDAQAGELAIFAAYYDDHQTKIHTLSDEEIRSIRADGIDVFYNMSRFTTGAARG